MFITVNQKFSETLVKAGKVTAKKTSSIDALKMILIEASEDKIRITGGDTETMLQLELPVDDNISVEETGSVLAPRELIEITKKMGISYSLEVKEKNLIKIKSNDKSINAEMEINGLSAEDYPKLPDISGKPTLNIGGEQLNNMIRKTAFAASDKETRPILTAVLVSVKDGKMNLAATDACRFAKSELNVNIKEEFGIPVPAKALMELSKVIYPEETVDIYITDRQFVAKSKGVTFISNLLEGTYPDVSRIIPEAKGSFKVSKGELIAALERLMILNEVISIKIEGQSLIIEAQGESGQGGKGRELMFVSDLNGNTVSLSMKAKYLVEAARSIDENEMVFKMSQETQPVILVPEKGDDLQLIMPIRTA